MGRDGRRERHVAHRQPHPQDRGRRQRRVGQVEDRPRREPQEVHDLPAQRPRVAQQAVHEVAARPSAHEAEDDQPGPRRRPSREDGDGDHDHRRQQRQHDGEGGPEGEGGTGVAHQDQVEHAGHDVDGAAGQPRLREDLGGLVGREHGQRDGQGQARPPDPGRPAPSRHRHRRARLLRHHARLGPPGWSTRGRAPQDLEELGVLARDPGQPRPAPPRAGATAGARARRGWWPPARRPPPTPGRARRAPGGASGGAAPTGRRVGRRGSRPRAACATRAPRRARRAGGPPLTPTPGRRSCRQGSCRQGSCRQGSCRQGSCRQGSCRQGSCRRGSCRRGSCRRGSCRRGSCRRGSSGSPPASLGDASRRTRRGGRSAQRPGDGGSPGACPPWSSPPSSRQNRRPPWPPQ